MSSLGADTEFSLVITYLKFGELISKRREAICSRTFLQTSEQDMNINCVCRYEKIGAGQKQMKISIEYFS